MPICYLTRIVEFSATHRIRRADWTEQQNATEFARAATEHEHRYQCRVTVKGQLHAEAGGVMSLPVLDSLLEDEVVRRFDGKSINAAAPEFADGRRLATGEALTVYVWEQIAKRLPANVKLHAVRVQEGPHLYSEYFGEA
ncbi:MAG TPA: 6-carboxytetrahydropterin synthase [Gemmatimonadales bacterium]|jgi:6-pyruvoyltetrahydropterin/6-carboxytetrahydropterin synthase|nr:6-carboxytetrahydropterin synthase [Gemmatimonadales bacterium]